MADYIAHHGVKGMKWGIRKTRKKTGSSNPRVQKESKFKENRHDRAARAAQRDADNLRKHGYTKEADAVQKVADIQRNKAAAKRAKIEKNAKKTRRNKPNDRRMFDEAVDFTATMMGARTAKHFLGMPYAATAVSSIMTKKQTKGRKAAEAVLIAKSAYSVGKIAYKIGQRNLERHNSMVNEMARENGYATYDWRGRRI